MEIKTIGIVGAGQMGYGIAQAIASANFNVILNDINSDIVQNGLNNIESSLNRLLEKKKINNVEAKRIFSCIKSSNNLADMSKADFVIETINENVSLKLELFRQLDEICRPEAPLASNTSSISITKIAGVTKRPELVIGMHFMNPVPIMKLVEVIRGLATSDHCFIIVTELAKKIGKIPIGANDYPGFISNRILLPMINEAIYCVMEGVGQPTDIDQIMQLGMNHPMGPLALADLIGLDTCLAILNVLHQNFGDSKYRPCPLLRKYVDQGWLGRKAKRGFFQY